LAKVLHDEFVDSDDLVEAAQGRSVRDIFAESGEPAFRAAECAAIEQCLRGEFTGVLALGGGALMHEPTRAAISAAGVPVAVLCAPLETLLLRVGDGRTRPLLHADPARRLAELAAERQPVFDALATMSVDTARRTPGQVAAHIAARLHELGALT
jgi:shikimate kinase